MAGNIVIRGNTINNCGHVGNGNYAGIDVIVYSLGFNAASGYCRSNITIQGNIITNWSQMGIYAASVTNLNLINNQIQSSATANSYGGNIWGMVFERGGGIVIDGGNITDPRPNLACGIYFKNTVNLASCRETNNPTFNLYPGVTNYLFQP